MTRRLPLGYSPARRCAARRPRCGRARTACRPSRMINYTDRLTDARAGHRRARARPCRISNPDDLLVFARYGRSGAAGAVRDLPLPHAAADATPATTTGATGDSGRMTRRSEWFVTKSPQVSMRRAADPLPDLVRAAALLRPDARRVPQAAVLSGRSRRGSRSSTPSCTSCITSIPRRRASAGSSGARRSGGCARTARASSRRSPGWSGSTWRAAPTLPCTTFLRYGFAELERAVRAGGRDDVPDVPVVPAALHRDARGAADRAAERAHPADQAAARPDGLHGVRPRDAPLPRPKTIPAPAVTRYRRAVARAYRTMLVEGRGQGTAAEPARRA